ncbi:recombinase family protein [Mammaliicoccus lentus]|uniref:recombinase family protein n=1 Tax=Mammaliicoccus lentus TaxID=42858 RepID=UPI00107235B9|nr:recombinase family protein [Mammaliicoccus lentus]MBF0793279.1 recombinase family protein [Mammaliicoccus lentus]TFV17788.1 recombinase family protein [Mammaliicoccus lentus]
MGDAYYYEEVAPEQEIKKVAIYARKSRAEEGEKDLANHLFRLESRCKLNDWDYTIYKEIGSGGNLSERPKMLKLLDDITKGLYEAVVVVDIDRLSRGKGADLDRILGTFRNNSVKIVQESPYEIYDLTNSNHAQVLEMKMFFGNMELMQSKKRFKEGKRLALYLGKWVNGNPPFGYELDRKTKEIVINEEEAEIFNKMKEIFFETWNTTETAWRLNSEGYKTKTGTTFTGSRVAMHLKNEFYVGTFVYNKSEGNRKNSSEMYSSGIPYRKLDKSQWKRKEDNHPALLTKEEHQKIINHFSKTGKRSTNNKNVYPLTGLCVTPTGETYTLRNDKGFGSPNKLVINKRKYEEKTAYRSVEVDLVLNTIYTSIATLKEQIALKLEDNNNEEEIKMLNKKCYALEREINKITNAIEKIQEGFIFGLYDANEAKNLKTKQEGILQTKEEELNDLNIKINKLSNTSNLKLDRLRRVENFMEDIKQNHTDEKLNEIFKSIIKDIVVSKLDDSNVDIQVNFL